MATYSAKVTVMTNGRQGVLKNQIRKSKECMQKRGVAA